MPLSCGFCLTLCNLISWLIVFDRRVFNGPIHYHNWLGWHWNWIESEAIQRRHISFACRYFSPSNKWTVFYMDCFLISIHVTQNVLWWKYGLVCFTFLDESHRNRTRYLHYTPISLMAKLAWNLPWDIFVPIPFFKFQSSSNSLLNAFEFNSICRIFPKILALLSRPPRILFSYLFGQDN